MGSCSFCELKLCSSRYNLQKSQHAAWRFVNHVDCVFMDQREALKFIVPIIQGISCIHYHHVWPLIFGRNFQNVQIKNLSMVDKLYIVRCQAYNLRIEIYWIQAGPLPCGALKERIQCNHVFPPSFHAFTPHLLLL